MLLDICSQFVVKIGVGLYAVDFGDFGEVVTGELIPAAWAYFKDDTGCAGVESGENSFEFACCDGGI